MHLCGPLARSVFALVTLAIASTAMAETAALPERIRVACDNNYPPYTFLDAQGALIGIVPDQWAVWSAVTGIPVELRGYSWSEAQRVFESGGADVLETAFDTMERRQKYEFSSPYASIEVPVFIHKSISGIRSAADLSGFHVAVKEGDASVESLSALGVTQLDQYPDYEEIVRAAANLETRIFCIDKPPALYYLYKYGADRDFRVAFKLPGGSFHRAVLKDRAYLLPLISKGFSAIPKERYEKIDRVWSGSPILWRVDLKLVVAIVTSLLVLLISSLVVAWALKRRVGAATEELREKVALLEESEARNKAFIAALPDLFFVFDKGGRCVDFSASDESQLALPPSAFIGHKLEELGFAPEIVGGFMQALASTLSTQAIGHFYYKLPVGGLEPSFEGRLVPLPGERALLVSRNVTELRKKEEELSRSLAEKEVLLKEIHHRVKNNMQVISSLLSLQSAVFRDPEDRRLLAETQARIRALALLHERLYDSSDLASISLLDYLRSLATGLSAGYGRPPVELEVPADLRLRIDDALPLGLIANELVSNAMKYAYPQGAEGRILVQVVEGDEALTFSVEDWGTGLAEALDLSTSSSMGFQLVRSLAAQTGASISFGGPPGLRVALAFPRR
jgi:two-component sensor histidine kinase/ABC-type amino acid transport substrate-binding protein